MKLKMNFFALLILALSFIGSTANAQVRAKVVIGGHPHHYYHHRTYVRPYYGYHHYGYHRNYGYHNGYYHHHYQRPVYHRRVVVRDQWHR